MGIFCLVFYKLGMMILPSNFIWTVLSILIAVVIYAVSLVFTKTITEDELYSMPKGNQIVRILKNFRLLK